ncbi:hypothetical protein [Halocatena marina]|uniref:hypothetical protein n=1 Tax=Halocatena marina TaxID=2934937 RepID=UPI00200EF5B6|nr:hypothetical protein [Halocatena marina]
MESKTVDEWINQLAADDFWGSRMDKIARQTICAMQYGSQDYTLDDLYRSFSDSDYREQIEEIPQFDGQKPYLALAERVEPHVKT